jgi:drug/metabolite transporter (DMT)-like permease
MLIITIVGDYFVKLASTKIGYTGWKILLLGGFLYGISCIGWFYAYRHLKVFTVGAFHSVGVIIFSILLSSLIFKEGITVNEWLGILLGCISLFLFFMK